MLYTRTKLTYFKIILVVSFLYYLLVRRVQLNGLKLFCITTYIYQSGTKWCCERCQTCFDNVAIHLTKSIFSVKYIDFLTMLLYVSTARYSCDRGLFLLSSDATYLPFVSIFSYLHNEKISTK